MNERDDDEEFAGRDADIACAFCGKHPHRGGRDDLGPQRHLHLRRVHLRVRRRHDARSGAERSVPRRGGTCRMAAPTPRRAATPSARATPYVGSSRRAGTRGRAGRPAHAPRAVRRALRARGGAGGRPSAALSVAVYNHYKRISLGARRGRRRRGAGRRATSCFWVPRARARRCLAQTLARTLKRAVRHRGRHHAHRGRLRGRGRGEHPAQAHDGGRLRHPARRDRHHLHRRDRQGGPQGREPVHHARRVRRGRAAGAPEDRGGHGGQRARRRAAASTPSRSSSISTPRTSCSSWAARSSGLADIIADRVGKKGLGFNAEHARVQEARRGRAAGPACCRRI